MVFFSLLVRWCSGDLFRLWILIFFNFIGMRVKFLHFSFLFTTLLQFAIVEHYFVDGAIHVCQTGGACDAVKE